MELLYQWRIHRPVRRWWHAASHVPRLGLLDHTVPDEEEKVLELVYRKRGGTVLLHQATLRYFCLRLTLLRSHMNKTLTFIDRNEKNNQYLSSSLTHAYNLSMDDFFL